MSAMCFEGTTTNPEILAIADRVFRITRLSMQRAAQKVAGRALALPTQGIEQSARVFFEKYRPLNRDGVDQIAGLSRFGILSRPIPSIEVPTLPAVNLDFNVPKTLIDQAHGSGLFENLGVSRFPGMTWDNVTKTLVHPSAPRLYAKELAKIAGFKKLVSGGDDHTPTAPTKARELHLKLKSLKALHRYGWEPTDWGNDVIDSGGDGLGAGGTIVAGSAVYQQHIKAPQFRVGEFRRDGQLIDITPDRTFVKFDLNAPPADAWPRAFIANVFISETDASGDFIEFLQKLWEQIGSLVVSLATSAATALVGAAVGALIGTEFMPLVGTLVGALVGAVIGAVVGWLVDTLKDDIFETPDNPLSIILPTQDSLFEGGSKTSPIQIQDFNLGHARYLMNYYWELVF